MNRTLVAISAPAVSGLVLLVLVFYNLDRFESGSIEVRAMLARELPVFLLGVISCLSLMVGSGLWLIKGQWSKAIYSVISILVFLSAL